MTIPSTPRKAGPLLGNGVTTSFPFSFKVFAATDVKVVIADSAGVETVLVLDSDYTVTLNPNQDTSPGGTVNYPISGSPLPSGSVLSIIGNIDYDQPLDLPSGGNFSPLALENQLDRTTMQIQQLREEMDRTVKLPPTSSESVEELADDLQRIADSADNLDTVANNIADVNTVAANIADVTTVADNVTDITNFADVYQGGKAADPALRNDGSALQPGDLYFNTTTGRLRVFDGTVWREGNAGSITVERFSGNGSQTAFTLNTAPSDENNTQVYISGVYQQKNTYSVSGTTLTFDVAPPAGTNNIEVVVMRVLPLGNADASLISFLPAGAGAVATTVEAKLREFVSVKDFGAVGDGSTDDTAAIQAAIDYVSTLPVMTRRVLYFPPGQYAFTELTIPDTALGIALIGSFNFNSWLYCTSTDQSKPAINCAAQEAKFYNLSIRSATDFNSGSDSKIGLNLDKGTGPTITADVDAYVINCRISYFHTGIRIKGRGLRAAGCTISTCYYGVRLEWPNVGDYAEGSETSQKDGTGFRGHVFTDNRFHSIGYAAVANIGANASKLWGLQIIGSHQDIGRRIFSGHLGTGALIADCVSAQSPVAILELLGGQNYLITGITGGGDGDQRNTARIIEVRGTHANGTFRDLVLSHCTGHAFDMRDGAFTGIRIENITFNDVCTDVGSFNPISVVGENHEVYIDGVQYNGSATLTGIVRGSSSSSAVRIRNARAVGNSTPVAVGAANTDVDTVVVNRRGTGHWFDLYDADGSTLRGYIYYGIAGTGGVTIHSEGSLNLGAAGGSVRPMADDAINLGTSLWRWGTVFATTGTINTSDAREKQDIAELDEAERRVAHALKGLVRKYRFKDAVDKKGDSARIHVGLIAQDVVLAFEAEGLDPMRYGIVCHDEEDGIDRYGLRYEELMAFIIAAM